jgi:CBS domain-containing protein
MQVLQLMTPAPRACGPGTNLCEAVQLMWEGDLGALPVVDEAGVVRGVLTDRDIAIALGTRNHAAARLRVADVVSRNVQTCRPEDDVEAALGAMREHRVRRLPVVDAGGRLCGILSLSDVILAGDGLVRTRDLVETLRRISTPRGATHEPLIAAA